jgi:hypothetical protein
MIIENHTEYPYTGQPYTDKFLIDGLLALSRKLGRTPTIKDLPKTGKATYKTYCNYFGGLTQALKAAGFYSNNSLPQITPKELINCLQALAKQLGRIPNSADIKKAGTPGFSLYIKHFGSLQKAHEAAGYKAHNVAGYTDVQLISYLQELNKKLGRRPNTMDLKNTGGPSYLTYQRRFGKFKKALDAAGLKTNNDQKKYSEEERKELIANLQAMTGQLGRAPRSKDIKVTGKLSYRQYCNCFGNIKQALKAAGFEDTNRPKRYTDEQLINHLRGLAKKLERIPGATDIEEAGLTDYKTYYNRFGGIKKIFKASGIKINFKKKKMDISAFPQLQE